MLEAMLEACSLPRDSRLGREPPSRRVHKRKNFLMGREPARATEVAHILAREQELHNLQNKL